MAQPQQYGSIREFLDNLPHQPCIWQPENQNICVTCLRINEPVARICSVWSQALDNAPLEELDFEEEMRSLPAVEKVADEMPVSARPIKSSQTESARPMMMKSMPSVAMETRRIGRRPKRSDRLPIVGIAATTPAWASESPSRSCRVGIRNAAPCIITAADDCPSVLATSIAQRRPTPTGRGRVAGSRELGRGTSAIEPRPAGAGGRRLAGRRVRNRTRGR